MAEAQQTIKSLGVRLDNASADMSAMNGFASLVENSLGPSFAAFRAQRGYPANMSRHEPVLRVPRFIPVESWDYSKTFEEMALMVDYIDDLEVMECSVDLDLLRGQRIVRVRIGQHDTVSYALSRHCFKGWTCEQAAEEIARQMAELMVTTPAFTTHFMGKTNAR